MKDYRLSEIKEICENRSKCALCPCYDFCAEIDDNLPSQLDIEPRDMIELPCKEHFTYTHDNGHITENWRVYYRSEFDLIETAIFPTESEADEFLARLKGGK